MAGKRRKQSGWVIDVVINACSKTFVHPTHRFRKIPPTFIRRTASARESSLAGERGKLLEQNEMARQKIETMINRLRNLNAE